MIHGSQPSVRPANGFIVNISLAIKLKYFLWCRIMIVIYFYLLQVSIHVYHLFTS